MSYFAIASIVISAAATAYGIEQSKAAAEAEAKTRENLLERRQADARNALRENTRRRLEEKKRRLARIRVQNAASGLTNSGTQLAVFGEIESRLDEGIDEATSRGMGTIGNYAHQIELSKFQTRINAKTAQSQHIANVGQSVRKYAKSYASNYDRTGSDPFSIYS